MISKEEVKNIAKLARLDLSYKDIENYQKELSMILDYIEKLKKADVPEEILSSGSEIISYKIKKEKSLTEKEKINKELVELAPEAKNGYFKVKSIF